MYLRQEKVPKSCLLHKLFIQKMNFKLHENNCTLNSGSVFMANCLILFHTFCSIGLQSTTADDTLVTLILNYGGETGKIDD